MTDPSYLWPANRRNLWKTLARQLGELPIQEMKDVATIIGSFAAEMDTLPPYDKHELMHVRHAASWLNSQIQSVQHTLAKVCVHSRVGRNACSYCVFLTDV